jgi:UDP-N-acetylmuramoyl-tripeptide--D-alanyl-D-alanine ligase
MKPLSLSTLALMGGATLLSGNPATAALRVSKDTRTIVPGDLYVALKGPNFDGGQFVAEAAAKGAVGALCDGDAPPGLPDHFGILSTPDVLSSLTLMAASWRKQLDLRSVVVTGSSGKTSTKDFTASVLGSSFSVTATEGNLNNHIGLPLSILEAMPEDKVAVWEIGMNHRGEIAPLAGLADPDIGIITGIGTAHIEHLGSREAIASEKGDLLEKIRPDGWAILPADSDFLEFLRRRTSARVIEAGIHRGDLRATSITTVPGGSRFVIEGDFGHADAFLPVPGRHMVGNAMLAVASGIACGIPLGECAAALASVAPAKGRLTPIPVRGLTLLDDTYNANPDSMTAALEAVASFPCQGRRIAVLGRMGELGNHAAEAYERVGRVSAGYLDMLLCVGTEAAAMAESAARHGLENTLVLTDNQAAAKTLSSLAREGDVILLKGSRSARMEEVIRHFS